MGWLQSFMIGLLPTIASLETHSERTTDAENALVT
jgi:hypothetical protein